MAQLLFFDTFSHEQMEELNLDLVQFPWPVYVTEVRVIPLGARVQADFPGGVRLGATNPTSFSVEFFVNDLGRPGGSTFESIGLMEYSQVGKIQMEVLKNIPTDGLVLKGQYSTITIAIYGSIPEHFPDQLSNSSGANAKSSLNENDHLSRTNDTSDTHKNNVKNEHAVSDLKFKGTEPIDSSWIDETRSSHSKHQWKEKDNSYLENFTSESSRDKLDDKKRTAFEEWGKNKGHREKNSDIYAGKYEGRTNCFESEQKNESLDERTKEKPGRRSPSFDSAQFLERSREEAGRDDSRSYRNRSPGSWSKSSTSVLGSRRSPTSFSPDRHSRGSGHREKSPSSIDRSQNERIRSRNRSRSPLQRNSRQSLSPRRRHSKSDSPKRTFSRSISPRSTGSFSGSPKVPTPRSSSAAQDAFEDNFSDISDSDIPEIFDGEESSNNRQDSLEKQSSVNEHTVAGEDYSKVIDNEDIEEISDIEEWSDTEVAFDDMVDFVIGEDWEDPIRTFNVYNIGEFDSLKYFNKKDFISGIEDVEIMSYETRQLLELVQQMEIHSVLEASEKQIELLEKMRYLIKKPEAILNQVILESIVKWSLYGLDYDVAVTQPLPAFKVRHIKSGLKFIETALGNESVMKCLLASGIQQRLLLLLDKPYMALSLKLLILRNLDFTFQSKIGISLFLGRLNLSDLVKSNNILFYTCYDGPVIDNPYIYFLKTLQKKQGTRIKFAITSLLSKFNLIEILEVMNEILQKIIVSYSVNDKSEEKNKIDYKTSTLDLSHGEANLGNVSEAGIQELIGYLYQINNFYLDAKIKFSQPLRYLPSEKQIEVSDETFNNPYFSFFYILKYGNFLNIILTLLTCPVTSSHCGISGVINEILNNFLSTREGILYFAEENASTSFLVKNLLQTSVSEGREDENLEDSASTQTGIQIAHHVYAIVTVDKLFYYATNAKFQDTFVSFEVNEALQNLYSMTFTSVGIASLVKILTFDNNIQTILPHVTAHSKDLEHKKELKKSSCRGYASELLLLVIRHSDNIDFLKSFIKPLMNIANQDDHSKLSEISYWLKPINVEETLTFNSIKTLGELIKKKIEKETFTQMPVDLITYMRLLKSFCVPLNELDLVSGTNVELKYKCAIVEMYAADIVASSASLLQQICASHEQPALHTATFVGSQGFLIVSIIHPTVKILQRIITYLVYCRDVDFKDHTLIQTLLKTYTLMYSVPTASLYHFRAQDVCHDIIATLQSYTRPAYDMNKEGSGAISNTLWTRMLTEVVKYTLTAPYTYLSGLLLLSELLPLPLPLQTVTPLSESEKNKAVNCRKLWGAHILSAENLFNQLITVLAPSTYPGLVTLLRQVCIQIADLAAPTAFLISKCILNCFFECFDGVNFTSSEDQTYICNSFTTRLLCLLVWTLSQAVIKAAVIKLISENESYKVLIKIFHCILTTPSEEATHQQAQEYVVSIIQSLCDAEVSLVFFESQSTSNTLNTSAQSHLNISIANSLPIKEHLNNFVSSLLNHISIEKNSFSTLIATIRTLVLFTDHNYGFNILKYCLYEKPMALYKFFQKLVSVENMEVNDKMSIISASLAFLQLLTSTEDDNNENCSEMINGNLEYIPSRTDKLSMSELAYLLNWSANSEEETEKSEKSEHPFYSLKKQIDTVSEGDENFLLLHNLVSKLINNLGNCINIKSEFSSSELAPTIPESQSLLEQFSQRPVFVICEVEEERLTIAYWLFPPLLDDQQSELDLVNCDILALAESNISNFDLISEVREVCREKTLDTEKKLKKKTLLETKALQNKALISTFKERGTVHIRGRGFSRTNLSRIDQFRSRPPNTSRPPSLHVDDFLVLELKGQQPTGPTGYNKQSMKAAKELFNAREVGQEPIRFHSARGRPFIDRGGRFERGGYRGRVRTGWTSDAEARVSRSPDSVRSVHLSRDRLARVRVGGWHGDSLRSRRLARGLGEYIPSRHLRSLTR